MSNSNQNDMSSQKKSNQVKSDKTESKLDKNDKLSESPEPTISIPENDFGKEHVAKDLESGAKHKKENKKVPKVAVSLTEFLERCIKSRGKLRSQDKNVFDRLDRDLPEKQMVRLVNLFLEKDTDLKYCQALSNFLVEGSRDSSIRLQTFNFIERVISKYHLFKDTNSNSIFQTWLHKSSDKANKLEFFKDQFELLQKNYDTNNLRQFTKEHVTALVSISASWLFFKKESEFSNLTRYLRRSVFANTEQVGYSIENRAFAFATSMISSPEKKRFGYFLQIMIDQEIRLSQQLQIKLNEANNKTTNIKVLTDQNINLSDKLSQLETKNELLESKIKALEIDANLNLEKNKHQDIRHDYSSNKLTTKLTNVLEGELKDVLEKARTAHQKEKHAVVEYQIDDALDILSRELKGIKTHG